MKTKTARKTKTLSIDPKPLIFPCKQERCRHREAVSDNGEPINPRCLRCYWLDRKNLFEPVES